VDVKIPGFLAFVTTANIESDLTINLAGISSFNGTAI